MDSKKIKAKALTVTIKNKDGGEYAVSGYKFANRLILILGTGDDTNTFFESLGVLRLSAPEGSTLSTEEGQECELTEWEVLDSVMEIMKKNGSRGIPMERILYLLWQTHSPD